MQTKLFKYLLTIGMLSIFLGACTHNDKPKNETPIKSGAGGIIEVVNKTYSDLYVTWSGVGCAGIHEGLSLVCETGTIPPRGNQTYGYNWGVTTTWINIGTDIGTDGTHPCSPLASTFLAQACIYNHHVIDTDAHKVDRCTVTYSKAKGYHMDCERQ
ncbi:MAG: hypothetical protein FE834_02010 [Gammaproteobacteria bacterium]|nr:hypothetical protein [Gammaproteobacteria bacterium]